MRFLIVAILAIAFFIAFQGETEAQQQMYYLWTDSLAVSTTAVDTTFPRDWDQVTLWSQGCSIFLQFGSPGDTDSTATRFQIRLESGMGLKIGPEVKLRRLIVEAVSGTGTLYLAGIKRAAQN